jgi:hypothetical protein
MTGSKDFFGIKGSTFTIRLEYTKEIIIVHLPEVSSFSKATLKEMKELLDQWSSFFSDLGFNGVWAGVPKGHKVQRLLLLLGFVFKGVKEETLIFQYGER